MGQKLSATASAVYLRSIGRVYNQSDEFIEWDSKTREVRALQLNVAAALSERSQVFLATGFLEGSYEDRAEQGTTSHMSDTLFGYTYEVLPEHTFSYWKPKVHVTAMVNAPTGHSIYDEGHLSEGADVTGHNQWGGGLGLTATKVYFPWTLVLQGRVLSLQPRTFDAVEVGQFFDSSVSLLAQYASRWQGLVLLTGLTRLHLSSRTVTPVSGVGSSVSSEESENWAVIVGAQKSVNENYQLGLVYSDQTLVGPARNSILNRSLSLTVNFNTF
ncbi:MAG: hypothetical protein AAF202_04610 [Pseudomonadota bacterium]